MPCLDLVSMGRVFEREEEVNGTNGVVDSIMDSVVARGGDSTWLEERTILEEGKVTSTEVAMTLRLTRHWKRWNDRRKSLRDNR